MKKYELEISYPHQEEDEAEQLGSLSAEEILSTFKSINWQQLRILQLQMQAAITTFTVTDLMLNSQFRSRWMNWRRQVSLSSGWKVILKSKLSIKFWDCLAWKQRLCVISQSDYVTGSAISYDILKWRSRQPENPVSVRSFSISHQCSVQSLVGHWFYNRGWIDSIPDIVILRVFSWMLTAHAY